MKLDIFWQLESWKYLRTYVHNIYPLVWLFMKNDSRAWTRPCEGQDSDVLQSPLHPGYCWTYAVLALPRPVEIQENVLSLDTVATAASAGNTWDQESGDVEPGAVSSIDERDLWTVMFPLHVRLDFGSTCNLPTSAFVPSHKHIHDQLLIIGAGPARSEFPYS